MSDPHHHAKTFADIAAVAASVSAALQMIAPLFGLVGCVWTLMRIAEMVTGKTIHQLLQRGRKGDGEGDGDGRR